jgi:hypothetical protein
MVEVLACSQKRGGLSALAMASPMTRVESTREAMISAFVAAL